MKGVRRGGDTKRVVDSVVPFIVWAEDDEFGGAGNGVFGKRQAFIVLLPGLGGARIRRSGGGANQLFGHIAAVGDKRARHRAVDRGDDAPRRRWWSRPSRAAPEDRKSTRLNS